MLPSFGTCLVLEKENRIIGELSLLTGTDFINPGHSGCIIGACLYAIAVHKRYRGKGYGKLITKAGAQYARKAGAEFLWLHPAEAGLYPFYEKTIGLRETLRRRIFETSARRRPVQKISAAHYLSFREKLLLDKPHLLVSLPILSFCSMLEETYGGGLFATENGLCMASVEDGVCRIHELLFPEDTPSAGEDLASAVAFTLGCTKAVYALPAIDGEAFIAATPGILPPDTVWNLSFE